MEGTHGPLLLIGGAEDKIGGRIILDRFVQLAGGAQAHIVIIAAASSFEDLVGRRYISLFTSLGAGRAEMLQVRNRTEARHALPLSQIDDATGIFITGGDQLKLTALFGGTPIVERIRRQNQAGVVVAGTSAGASAAPEHMLAYGAGGLTPHKAMMQFAPGLGLIDGLIVDQHFGARNRTGRLITAVAHNPDLLGLGLDEDTAVEITGDHFSVLGRGAVMAIDGANVSYSDIHRVNEGMPLAIFGLHVHVLTSGFQFNLASRTPSPPSAMATHAETGLTFGEGI
ncbi:MAG TPA: cyanophycinase [Roseiflexaceae bacterium]|nr:cyanophycinase [Roseiflexaceae bacterium]